MSDKAAVTDLKHRKSQQRASKADLLQARIIESDVPIQSLGDKVITLKTLTVDERREVRAASKWGTQEFDADKMEILTVLYAVKDPKLSESDLDEFVQQDSRVLDEITMQLSFLHMTGEVKDLKKGSGTTQNSDSDSSSPNDLE